MARVVPMKKIVDSDDGDGIVAGEDRLQGSEVRWREGEGDQRTSGFYL